MSPIVIIILAPLVFMEMVSYSVFLDAAAAGVWEVAEARAERRMSGPRQAPPRECSFTRAA